ncbi:MAG: acyl-CoA thioesterase [Nocardioidaceae bacterium]
MAKVRHHSYPCRVRWSDVDSYGHVNNVKYFEYFQEARIAFLSALTSGAQAQTERFVVARIDVDYRRPILFRPEPFEIQTWVSHVGTSSYHLAAEIRDGDEVLSRAHAVIVAFDTLTQGSRPLTDVERAGLQTMLEPA